MTSNTDASMSFTPNSHSLSTTHERYLGIDPGLNQTGYAVIERRSRGPFLVEGGILKSTRNATLHHRVYEIATGLREVLEELQPEVVAIEQVFSHVQNPSTAIRMAHARGAILLCLAEAAIPVVDYAPTKLKQLLTGSGKAPKEQIQQAVKSELKLSAIPEPNDVADAAALALCLYHSVKFAA